MNKIYKSGVYLTFTVAKVTQLAAKIGKNWRSCHSGQNLTLLETVFKNNY